MSTLTLTGAGPEAGVAAGGGTYAAAVLADSPVVYYRLGEPSGVTMNDSSGNTRNGSYVNSPTLGVAGATTDGNTAMTVNGTTQLGSVAHLAAFNLGDVWTLEAWIKRSATQGTNQGIISNGSGSYYMRMGTGNNLELVKSGIALIVASTTTITDTTGYHHVAATKNGTTCKVYIDGTDVSAGVTNATTVDDTNSLRVGADSDATDVAREFFSGTIDEAAVYATALSAARISAHFAAR